MAEPTVRVSGIVLSSLMFQHANTDSDAEGLVLGESRVEEQITISDSQADRIHIQEIYYVQKHIACNKLNHGAGEVNSVAVQKLLADNKQDSVLGWYRQRRNSEQQLSFRERIVHQSLKASLRNPHLLFLLLTPHRASSAESTHRTEYCAYISRNRSLRATGSFLPEDHQNATASPSGDTGEEEDLRRNLRLQEAVGALFKRSPLFLTQTLTLQGFPVPERTFSGGEEEEGEEEEAVCEEEEAVCEEEEAVCEEETQENTHSRKRRREMAASSERKRRKSES
ncbi:BRCA1-A complex subunit Abraxas 1 [Dissostichus eleginoides]|uniref:BRCA1-A complex subunit Abraxas 1 n=1 Tax=Dissostichus eleginoides TaxID=100907 RepID=A0AAD9BJT8_DISEL|nr:BRCA1-A complex subunit Abraxas 1 [Dissostichus eleginoides]